MGLARTRVRVGSSYALSLHGQTVVRQKEITGMYRIDKGDGSTSRKSAGHGERLLLVLLIGLAGLSVVFLTRQSLNPLPIRFAGITVDRLSAALTLLVAAVGAATYRFSMRYLDGDPGRWRFLCWLSLTVGTAYVLMLSTNLLLLLSTWSITSLGLHQLLMFYPDRVEARRSARKKFLISRLGDLALIAAIVLIWRTWSTMDLHVFLGEAIRADNSTVAQTVALLVVLAALTKSAQFPFHSWLPETMESPTPVSALMHAGIINAGGALLLRFSPLIIRNPAALWLLALVGTLTASLGMLAMWAQVKVKRTLAWSTVSQMGFMMVQCGLGVFPAAALHIIGHGCYKAWSFLRCGDLPGPTSAAMPAAPARTLALAAIGSVLSIPAFVLASWLTGFSPVRSPGELALSAIVALSIGQLWVALLRAPSRVRGVWATQLIVPLAATVTTPIVLFALYQGAEMFLEPVLGDLPVPQGPVAWAIAILPTVSFTVLVVVHALLPTLGYTASGRAFHVHALHGFYFGSVADRVVGRIWARFETKGISSV